MTNGPPFCRSRTGGFLCTDNGSKHLRATVIINGMACIQQESRPNMGKQLFELFKANENRKKKSYLCSVLALFKFFVLTSISVESDSLACKQSLLDLTCVFPKLFGDYKNYCMC